MHKSGFNLESFAPRRQAQSLAANRDEMIAAGVAGLFGVRGPFNISWFIVSIVVLAVYAVLPGRAFAHIGDERFGRISPAITDLNPTTAVIGESIILRVVASTNHSFPDFKHGMSRQPVNALCTSPVRDGSASAMRSRIVWPTQIGTDFLDDSAARASALPQIGTALSAAREFEDGEYPENLASKIATVRVELARIGVRHGSLRLAGCG